MKIRTIVDDHEGLRPLRPVMADESPTKLDILLRTGMNPRLGYDWLIQRNSNLGGQAPFDLMRNLEGRRQVWHALDAFET